MYFKCSTLRTTMKVEACEIARASKDVRTIKQSCRTCTKWQKETVDPKNIMTDEEALQPAVESMAKPMPKRVDHRFDIERVCSLSIGYYPFRQP